MESSLADLLPTNEELLRRAEQWKKFEKKYDAVYEEERTLDEEEINEESLDATLSEEEEEDFEEVIVNKKSARETAKFNPKALFEQKLLPLISQRNYDLQEKIRNMEFGRKVSEWLQNNASHMNGQGVFGEVSYSGSFRHFSTKDIDQCSSSSSSVNTTAYILANRGKGGVKRSRFRGLTIREYCFQEQHAEMFLGFGKKQMWPMPMNRPDWQMPLEMIAPQRVPAIEFGAQRTHNRHRDVWKSIMPAPKAVKSKVQVETSDSDDEVFEPNTKNSRMEKKRKRQKSISTKNATSSGSNDDGIPTKYCRNTKIGSRKHPVETSDSDDKISVAKSTNSRLETRQKRISLKNAGSNDSDGHGILTKSPKSNGSRKSKSSIILKNAIISNPNEIVIYEPTGRDELTQFDSVRITRTLLVEKLGKPLGESVKATSYLTNPMSATSKLVYNLSTNSLKEYMGVNRISDSSDFETEEEEEDIPSNSRREDKPDDQQVKDIIVYAPGTMNDKITGNIRITVELLQNKLPHDVVENLRNHPLLRIPVPASSTLLYNPISQKLFERF
ncbi:hypothetical protein DMENIID0001_129190 [Sergentomyia squamirostris]